MSPMVFKNLSDEALLSQAKELVFREREIQTQVLHHLLEIESRKLYLERGFSSLFEYAVRELGYAESAAYRRIASMRLMRDLPEIENKIEEGSLSLSVLAEAHKFFRQEKIEISEKREVLKQLENTSRREAEKILASQSTQPTPQGRLRAVSATESELKLVVNQELLDDLEKLKGLLAHSHPNASLSELLQIAVKTTLQKVDPAQKKQKSLPPAQPTRTINQALKTLIWKRDQGRCQYIDSKTGRRCSSQHALQIDHKIPYALGGPTSEKNLRLLCASHNRFLAEEIFGTWNVMGRS